MGAEAMTVRELMLALATYDGEMHVLLGDSGCSEVMGTHIVYQCVVLDKKGIDGTIVRHKFRA